VQGALRRAVLRTHTYFVGKLGDGVWVHNADCYDDIAGAIVRGHAFEKHHLFKGEFQGLDLRTVQQFKDFVSGIMRNAGGGNKKSLSGGRTAYWSNDTGVVVIHDPRARDVGTFFRPNSGKSYYDNLR